jgi:hypothetical protein
VFGSSAKQSNGAESPQRTAADSARILGGGLVQAILTPPPAQSPDQSGVAYVFLNDRLVPPEDVESLVVNIEVANDQSGGAPTLNAMLSRYVRTVTGERDLQTTELFPCTLVITARGRRIVITCPNAETLDGTWIELGLRPDGSAMELNGLQALRIVLSSELLDARITWTDGTTETLIPEN